MGSPTKGQDFQEFLGFANFYRWFIQELAWIVVSLIALTPKYEPCSWTPNFQKAFNMLKQRFNYATILAHFYASLVSIIETEASDYPVGAIHSQTQKNGRVHPVALLFRKFFPTEMNYDIHETEMVAIVLAFQEWIHQLRSRKQQILVWTHNKNLEHFTTSKVLDRLQARGYKSLAAFDFGDRYRPGNKNGKPDAVSRRCNLCPEEESEDLQPVHFLFKPCQLQISAMKATQKRHPLRNTLPSTVKKNQA